MALRRGNEVEIKIIDVKQPLGRPYHVRSSPRKLCLAHCCKGLVKALVIGEWWRDGMEVTRLLIG